MLQLQGMRARRHLRLVQGGVSSVEPLRAPGVLRLAEALPPDGRTARRRAPASCGELIRGTLESGEFLLNCPIDFHAQATVRALPCAGLSARTPEAETDCTEAIERFARAQGVGVRHELRLSTRIPRGRGLAAEAAGLTAALDAFAQCNGLDRDPVVHGRALAEAGFCHGLHLPGVAHVDPLSGAARESLPPPRDLRVLVLDCAAEVDAECYDRDRARALHRANRPLLMAALAGLRVGLRGGDLRLVAEAATQSTLLDHRILPRPQLHPLLALARAAGALGINCAHGGTVLGVLYRRGDVVADALAEKIDRAFGSCLELVGDFAAIGGGCRDATLG